MQTILVMCLAQKMSVNVCVCGLEERTGVNFDGLDGLIEVLKEHSAF